MPKKRCHDGRRNNRPPVHSQFKPGQSGNRGGRPKGVKVDASFDELIVRELMKRRSYFEEGEQRSATVEEMFVMQLVRLALKGNAKAAERVERARENSYRRAQAAAAQVPYEYTMEALMKLSDEELSDLYARTMKERNSKERSSD